MRPTSLGSLRRAVDKGRIPRRSIKRELRDNLMARLRSDGPLFPGIVGYDESVIPQVVNAILSQHDFVVLGLRGQAKTRLIRGLAGLLDESIPVVPGCDINDDPLAPVCAGCRARVEEEGDDLPVAWLDRSMRYVEKLATPDVTIADMIGDIDPIKAASAGRRLSDELTVHYGLLPRANRCIFAINELPDLAGKIQVGLFNILQEGDIQIRGYPVRLRLDVAMAFTANPEDYTARGKIVTPLKDRIGSEIRTHYPRTRHEAIAITEQEAWVARDAGTDVAVPLYVREVVEEIAFQARVNKRIDGRSGVSQRMPITCLENVVSNAERRALASGEAPAARVTDVYAALPAMTGKFELEYEGELRGADAVGRELIRAAVGAVFGGWFDGVDTHQVVEWFEMGGTLQESDTTSSESFLADVAEIHGLLELAAHAGIAAGDPPAQIAAAVDFVLEGLCAQRKISRSDGGGYEAVEKPRPPVQPSEPAFDPRRPMPRAGNKKKYYN
ncbi:MAG: magnesium chelatase [Acidobacteria bacterium]|nr:magnesium chelatase [Acidobacteriota bacterium]